MSRLPQGLNGRNGQIGILVERHLAFVVIFLVVCGYWATHTGWFGRLNDGLAYLVVFTWIGTIWMVVDWGCRIVGSENYLLGLRNRDRAKLLDLL